MALNDAAELLKLIRLRGSVPNNAFDWDSSAIYQQAWRELIERHMPLLLAARGEYLVKKTDLPLTGGQSDYRLPKRCAAVRSVAYLKSDGVEEPGDILTPPKHTQQFPNSRMVGRPTRAMFREHFLEVWPTPGSAGDSLRVRYHLRPSRPADMTNFALITGATAPSGTTVRYAFTTPAGPLWSTNKVDFIKSTSPFDIMAFDIVPVGSGVGTLDFNLSDLPQNIPEIGDYIAPVNYTPFLNVPVELHDAVALRTASTIVKIRHPGLAKELADEAQAKENECLRGVLAPRSKGNSKTFLTSRW